jgi:outer membrane protein assembly factor BamB
MVTSPKLSLVGLLLAVCAGCQQNWTSYGYDSAHQFKQPNESMLSVSTVSLIRNPSWDFTIETGGFSASPSVYDNTVYIGGLDGYFYAIYANGANQGTVRWKYPPPIAPNPADSCGTTTAPLRTGPPVIMGAGGNPSGPGIASSAAIAIGVAGHTAVIFGAPDPSSNGGDGRLWALDASTGQCIWKSEVLAPTAAASKIGYSSPTVAHGRAYVGIASLVADAPLTIGQVRAVMLDTGALDREFNFAAAGPAGNLRTGLGGGVWSSPAINAGSGNLIVTTGNSCRSTMLCPLDLPKPDYTQSMVELDWRTGGVIWQLQPVDIHWDHDSDFGASPLVAHASCGTEAIAIQKDGYVHAVDMPPGPNIGCSYPDHNLICPRWSFPTAQLPFQDDGHDDSRFIRSAALDGDHLFISAGGLNLSAADGFVKFAGFQSLHSLDICASDSDRIRWILPLDGMSSVPSVANGIIYVAVSRGPPTHRGSLYAIADTDTLPPGDYTCGFIGFAGGGLAPGQLCRLFGFQYVPVPAVVNRLELIGTVIGAPAISDGQVLVATTDTFLTPAGHVYAFRAPKRGPP